MAQRIPIPWHLRWQRFRYGALPTAGFVVCLAGTLWLWGRQAQLPRNVGEIEAMRVDVTASTDGMLASLNEASGRPWTLFDSVESNQVVARLDDRPIKAELDSLQEELVRLREDLVAEKVKLDLSESDRIRGYDTEVSRRQIEVEQTRLAVLDRMVKLESDRLDLDRHNTRVDIMKSLVAKKIISELEWKDEQMGRDEAAKALEGSSKTLEQVQKQHREAQNRLEKYAGTMQPLKEDDKSAILAPLMAAAKAQEARIRAVQIRITSLTVRAPIGGRIAAIYHWPGENVRAGDPIVAIAAPQGRFIVSYVRQDQRLQPTAGMTVEVRPRVPAAQAVSTRVESIGPQIEAIPQHQCRDPKVPEWGLPVHIAMPPDFPSRPGELVDVEFKKSQGLATN